MSSVWVFGYGSLIWRVDFPYAERRPAWIRHWARRFWQGSTDHRGVPGAPGRVVTLIEAPDAVCWGMAYRLDSSTHIEALAHLDHREKGGYERLELEIHFAGGDRTTGITYHATPDNPNFLGDTSSHAIVEQVLTAAGPSGPNTEYVLRLDQALREMEAQDTHVFEVARLLRERLDQSP